MERKIGEIFEYNGEWYQCVDWDVNPCSKCDFDGKGICSDEFPCTSSQRKDKKYVFFKKLEKVGETYEKRVSDGTFSTFQRYKVYNSVILPKKPYMYCNFIDNTIEIEIKQTKEDMEEKKFCEETSKANEVNMIFKIASKYINGGITYDEFGEAMRNWINGSEKDEHILKEFDLEAAKLGKPVCTRDGRKARIICFDRRLFYKNVSYPILALVECSDGEDDVCGYNEMARNTKMTL